MEHAAAPLRKHARAGVFLALACALGAAALPAQAGTASATLAIRVVVPPVTVIKLPARQVEFDLTADDIARGYATPAAALQVQVHTNLGPGLQLAVACASAPCDAAGAPMPAVQVPPGRGLRQHDLSVPLQLPIARDARPGTYRVAVLVTAVGH